MIALCLLLLLWLVPNFAQEASTVEISDDYVMIAYGHEERSTWLSFVIAEFHDHSDLFDENGRPILTDYTNEMLFFAISTFAAAGEIAISIPIIINTGNTFELDLKELPNFDPTKLNVFTYEFKFLDNDESDSLVILRSFLVYPPPSPEPTLAPTPPPTRSPTQKPPSPTPPASQDLECSSPAQMHLSCCTDDDPCGHGGGDCDGDDECLSGHICGSNNCHEFDSAVPSSWDCCIFEGSTLPPCASDGISWTDSCGHDCEDYQSNTKLCEVADMFEIDGEDATHHCEICGFCRYCEANCSGKSCGDDGCDGLCGHCGMYEICGDRHCERDCAVSECSLFACHQLGFTETAGSNVCGNSRFDGNCSGSVSQSEASSFCSFYGTRVCTICELEEDVTKGTNCNYDYERIWSSTPCGEDSYYTKGGAGFDIPTECSKDDEEGIFARCCADKSTHSC